MTVPNYWREIPRRYRLEGARCASCGKVFFPPRRICDGCRGRTFEPFRLSRDGELLTYTVIHVAPAGFGDQTPYAIGIIRLAEGGTLLAQVTDCDLAELREGLPVRLEFRKISEDGASGVIRYGYKAVPA